jgi:penicillin-binding protein 1A
MVASGAIDRAHYDAAKSEAVKLHNGLEVKETFGRYFKQQVQRELVDRFGWTRVAEGGLRVYTTLDTDLQQAAEEIVDKGLESIEHRRGYSHTVRPEPGVRKVKDDEQQDAENTAGPDYLQGALVAIDPTTGAVRALVGGRDFDESRFNRATQARRQSGSAFKPFVYAAALEAGYSPASLITHLNAPIETSEGDWVPEDEHSDATEMTMRSALRMSSNRAAVQMLDTIGIPTAVKYAEKLKVGTPPSVPSLALGASDVSLMSLTAAYGAFADKGLLHTPSLIRRVEDSDGQVLYENHDAPQRAVSEDTAFLMTSMLADVVNSGTAYKARLAGFTLPAAGKTGTTNDYVDAWFVGYTTHLVTGVWLGFDRPQTIMRNGYAGDLAVPIWTAFMKTATKGQKPDWFDKPSDIIGVNVCRLSGLLPNDGCSHVQVMNDDGTVESRNMVYTDYFVKGRQPTTTCPLHPGRSMFATIAGAIGIDVGTPRPVNPSMLPSATPTTGVAAANPNQPQPQTPTAEKPKKKRGFWSKLFGIGDDKKNDDKKKEQPKKPGGGGR